MMNLLIKKYRNMLYVFGGIRMSKKFFQSCVPIGALILFISLITRNCIVVTDFVKGYFEGMALVFFVIGLIYYIYCFIKKQRPY